MSDACCGPSADRDPGAFVAPGRVTGGTLRGLIDLPGGEFLMGSEDQLSYPGDGEGPVRPVTIAPFAIAETAVTVAEFAEFVGATGYLTEAEHFGNSFVFAGLLPDDHPPTRGVAAAPWWREVDGATWRLPAGPGSPLRARPDHPVVHVSHRDAIAYAGWAGARLPTEAEWEFAARGGLVQQPFPWGGEREPGGRPAMNVWSGAFPGGNTKGQDWVGTEPAKSYRANGFGLYNTTGNVWEWCADEYAPGQFVSRGGSYLCHASYCRRYRTSARQGLSPDSTTGNTGFRCAR